MCVIAKSNHLQWGKMELFFLNSLMIALDISGLCMDNLS